MSSIFPVTHSTPSVEALMTDELPNYDIEPPTSCKLLQIGLNDTFLVNTQGAEYILRVYRAGWRTSSEIHYEIEALLHLKRKGISISVPVARKDGNLVGTIMAPEGLRYIVLFTYAPGKEIAYTTDEENESYLYGKATAKIHAATDTFQSAHERFSLNLDYLLEVPLQTIRPHLSHRPEDWEYMLMMADKLRQRVQEIPLNSLETGFCHGDFHGWNAHLDKEKVLTFFDFDCCGMGWRAYDIAIFRWGARLGGKDSDRWQSFLRGYTEERNINDLDLQATQYFVAIRHFWFMGLQAENSADFGLSRINDGFFDRALKFFREWEKEYLR